MTTIEPSIEPEEPEFDAPDDSPVRHQTPVQQLDVGECESCGKTAWIYSRLDHMEFLCGHCITTAVLPPRDHGLDRIGIPPKHAYPVDNHDGN